MLRMLLLSLLLSGCAGAADLENVLNSPSTQHERFADALERQPIKRVPAAHLSLAQLQTLNEAVNTRMSFCPDWECTGSTDTWLTPIELQRNGWRGDCEDGALAKYYALSNAGMPPHDLRIAIVLPDEGGVHAILGARLNGVWYILDNMTDDVLAADLLHHYKGHVSFNENTPMPGLHTEAE